MTKIRLKTILLLTLAGIIDVFKEVKDPLNMISKYYENFYGYVQDRWKKSNVYSLLRRSLKNEEIIRIDKSGSSQYQMTKKGLNKVTKCCPTLFLKQKKWDQKWRVVVFDIEETNRKTRDLLRNYLKYYGFGYLQKSVWISPYDVFDKFKNIIEKYKIANKVILFETIKFSFDNENIANQVWPINKLNNEYFNFYKKLQEIEKLLNNKIELQNINFSFKKIYKELVQTIFKDPHLPYEVLPKNWYYRKTVNLAKKIRRTLINKSSNFGII